MPHFPPPVQEKEGEGKAEPDRNKGEFFLLSRQGGVHHLPDEGKLGYLLGSSELCEKTSKPRIMPTMAPRLQNINECFSNLTFYQRNHDLSSEVSLVQYLII